VKEGEEDPRGWDEHVVALDARVHEADADCEKRAELENAVHLDRSRLKEGNLLPSESKREAAVATRPTIILASSIREPFSSKAIEPELSR
jgi:hypothetical protein